MERDSISYKIAKRYGLIKESEESIIFYFEQLQQRVDRIKYRECAVWNLEDEMWFFEMSKYVKEKFNSTMVKWLEEFKDAQF